MRFTSDERADERPVWLSQQELDEPSLILAGFIKEYTLTDCRFLLWKILVASLSAENQDSIPTTPEKVFFFENLMPFIEATYLSVKNGVNSLNFDSMERSDSYDPEGNSISHEKRHKSADQTLAAKQHVDLNNALCLKKCQKHLRKNSIWYRETIEDPYQALASFFDSYSITEFQTDLYGILRASSENHVYQKTSPADVIYFFEKLESIINAGYIILELSRNAARPNDDGQTCESVPEFYGQNRKTTEDQGMLSLEEQGSGIIATLHEFFEFKSLQQWKEELYEICVFSLSNQAAQLWTVWIDSLPIYVYIKKLVVSLEAYQATKLTLETQER